MGPGVDVYEGQGAIWSLLSVEQGKKQERKKRFQDGEQLDGMELSEVELA